jgi:SAM-dependent methyltransferase
VYKVAPHLAEAVERAVLDLSASRVVEVGTPTGLLLLLGAKHPGLRLISLDRDGGALDDGRRRAAELGLTNVEFVPGDLFHPESWASHLGGDGPGVLGSIHFHEFVADGGERVRALLPELRRHLPGWHVFAIEQPRLGPEDRPNVSPNVWLYSHSNVLIHHLIRNGRILTHEQWRRLFLDAGCREAFVRPLGYLGYHLYVYAL